MTTTCIHPLVEHQGPLVLLLIAAFLTGYPGPAAAAPKVEPAGGTDSHAASQGSTGGAAESSHDEKLQAGAAHATGAPAAPRPDTSPGIEALDQAFRFASAIHTDLRDMGQAQQSAVLAYLEIDAFDEAAGRADQVTGWRRGVVYAQVAEGLAKDGRKDEARALVRKAEAYRATVEGWQNLRISAHVAQVLALLGDVEESERISSDLAANDRVYAGRSVATVATGHAATGRFDEAMKHLEALDSEKDLDYTWWRTAGYLAVAQQAGLSREKKLAALKAAERSAEGIAGWKQAEALQSIAQELRRSGEEKHAKALLKKAEEIVEREPRTLPMKAPLLSNLARSWAQLGAKDRAASLLDEANEVVPKASAIDRPAVIANIASSYAALGEQGKAVQTYERALEDAATLVNSRPRALAVSSVCSSMGRSRVPLTDTIKGRLESLYAGLGDPW